MKGRLPIQALVTAGALLLAVVPAASAAVVTAGGFSYVSKRFSPDAGVKRFEVACPAGTHVYGGGHYNDQTFGQVLVSHSSPYDSDDRRAKPDDGWQTRMRLEGDGFRVRMHAVCAEPGPRYVTQSGFVISAGAESIPQLGCPSGTNLTSGGSWGPLRVVERSGYPTGGVPSDTWRFRLHNVSARQREVELTAVCSPGPVSYNTAAGFMAPGTLQSNGTSSCGGAQHVVGGGVENESATVRIAASHPEDQALPASDWRVWVDNYGTTPIEFDVHASCSPAVDAW